MSIRETFDNHARQYDALRRKLIPCYEDLYGIAVSRLEIAPDKSPRILDLGAGTGIMSWHLLQRFPQARLTLVDLSGNMLEQARQRFKGKMDQVEFLNQDYIKSDLGADYDAVFSALSIHHLAAEDKRKVFGNAYNALRPGGVFTNVDQCLGETEAVEQMHRRLWLDMVFKSGIDGQDFAQAKDRMRHDQPSTLQDQLHWLSQAGFINVDCHYKWYAMAVFSGVKP